MSDKDYKLQKARIDGHELRLDSIADKLKALEKNQKHYNNLDKELTHWVGIMDKNKEQIAKLQENQKNGAKQHLEFIKSINELKSDIGNINKILEVITEGRVLELEAFNNLEDVLRKFFTYLAGYNKLEKPKTIEPEKEFEFQLVEKFIPPRGVHCENCMNNPVPELIEGFKDKLEFLRDKVLEAPILSGSVQDLRDHIHDLKDLVVKNINEYEGRLK